MRVPYSWLQEYCDPGVEPGELAERLAMTGTEVERVGAVGPPSAEGFVVGKVLSAEPHPNADRLRVCKLDTGDGNERIVVCGAPNVAAGQTVPVALPGATMPGGMEIGEAKLRGVRSAGMICSASELGVGESPRASSFSTTVPVRRIPVWRGIGTPEASRPARRWPRCCRWPSRCWSWR